MYLEKLVFTTSETSKLLGVDVGIVDAWVGQEKLRAWKTPSGYLRLNRREIERFVQENGLSNPFSPPPFEESPPIEEDRPDQAKNKTTTDDPIAEKVLDAFERGSMSAPEVQEVTEADRSVIDTLLERFVASGKLVTVRHIAPKRYAQLNFSDAILKTLSRGALSVPEIQYITHLDRTEVEKAIADLRSSEQIIVVREEEPVRFGLPEQDSAGTVAKSDAKPMNSAEDGLVSWCRDLIANSPADSVTVRLAELVNRRGLYTANKKLRTKALREVCVHLHSFGLHTQPDYRNAKRSPGVEAVALLTSTEEPRLKPLMRPSGDMLNSGEIEHYLDIAMALAHSDGQLPDSELTAIQHQAEARMQSLTDDEQSKLRASMAQLRDRDIDLDEVIGELARSLKLHERHQLLEELFDVAMADGVFHEQEELFLRKLHQAFDTAPEHFEGLVSNSQMVSRAAGPQNGSTTNGDIPSTENDGVADGSEENEPEHREINYLFSLLTGR